KRSRKSKKLPPAGVLDPWLAPPLEAPPELDWRAGLPADVVEQGVYGVREIEPPPPPPPPPLALPDEEPLPVRPAPPSPQGKGDQRAGELPPVSEYELQLVRRHEPPPPAWPMITGVYSFLAYPATLGPLLTIALGFFLMGLVLKGQQAFFPF